MIKISNLDPIVSKERVMIEFIKAMAEAFGWPVAIFLLFYFSLTAIIALVVSISIIFGG